MSGQCEQTGFERFSNLPMLIGVLRQLDGEIDRRQAEIADMQRRRAFILEKFRMCCAPPIARPSFHAPRATEMLRSAAL